MSTPITDPNPVTGPILLPVPREARRELAGRQAVSAATIAAELRSRLHDADFATRQAILRLLMAAPATLTQLGERLGEHPAWVRHHLKQLEAAGLVEVSEIRKTKRVTKKFYWARADGLVLQEIILPKTGKPTVVISGSHDLAVEEIGEQLNTHVMLLSLPVGSMDGLVNLRHGLSQISGSHLLMNKI